MKSSISHPSASTGTVVDPGSEAARYDRERTAHNKIFSEHTRDSALKYYCILHQSRAHYEGTLLAHCSGSSTLEYGCGQGTHSSVLAQRGAARVVGIDISDVAIEQARAEAFRRGLTQMEHFQMNAETLQFEADSFDRQGARHRVALHEALCLAGRVDPRRSDQGQELSNHA